MKLGLVPCSNEEYHGSEGESKSRLDVVARSPAHYFAAYEDPNRAPRKPPTPALVTGTAIHAAILEPDVFATEFVIAPDVDRRTKAGRAEHAAFVEEHEGKTILTQEQWDIASGCRDSAWRNKEVARALRHGKAEQTYYAIDPDTGALIKCRFDWLGDDGSMLDVKSTIDASPQGFIRSVLKYRYHVQEAWYRHVMSAALDIDAPWYMPWSFLAIEKEPPYACKLYTLPRDLMHIGELAAHLNLKTIVQCRKSGEWPAYGDDPMELPMPASLRIETEPEDDFGDLE